MPAGGRAADRLAREQPVAGAEIVALELHVDYFDSPGNVDPFAQASFGVRQADYLRAFGKRGTYTPQLVIDGEREMVGSREREARDAIADAARAPRAKVQITRTEDRLSVTVDGLADVGGSGALDLMLAVTEDGLAAQALGGDGARRGGVHGPVVRELRKVSTLGGGTRGPVQVSDVVVHVDGSWRRENLRAAAFVQREKTLEILGAGVISLQ